MKVAIFGARNTGKSALAQALSHSDSGLEISEPASIIAGLRHCVLLMGLDLRPPTPGEETQDAHLRAGLSRAGLACQVVYGSGDFRLRNALQAIFRCGAPVSETVQNAWVWPCDKCSDPDCEHRLFGRLLGR